MNFVGFFFVNVFVIFGLKLLGRLIFVGYGSFVFRIIVVFFGFVLKVGLFFKESIGEIK